MDMVKEQMQLHVTYVAGICKPIDSHAIVNLTSDEVL